MLRINAERNSRQFAVAVGSDEIMLKVKASIYAANQRKTQNEKHLNN